MKGQVGSSYKIRIAALKRPFNESRFDNIKDLGVVLFEGSEGEYTRVYLGSYLGQATAEYILQEVKNRGYNSPYIEKQATVYQEPYHKELTHTIQLIALSKLDLDKIYEHPNMSSALNEYLFVNFYEGLYHISLGLVEKSDSARILQFKQSAYLMGYNKSYLKPIHQDSKNQLQPTQNDRRVRKAKDSKLKLRPVKTPENN